MKSSKEVRKESVAPSKVDAVARETGQSQDVSCSEILQSRLPFIRSIIKILGGSNYSVREKLEPVIALPRPPPPSVAFLQVSDGSCASSLQVIKSTNSFSFFHENPLHGILVHVHNKIIHYVCSLLCAHFHTASGFFLQKTFKISSQ